MNIHQLRFVRGLHLSVFPVSLFLGHQDMELLNEFSSSTRRWTKRAHSPGSFPPATLAGPILNPLHWLRGDTASLETGLHWCSRCYRHG